MNSQEKRPTRHDPDWTELNDKSMADWRSIRKSIEHENQLVNYRFTWLLTFETLLFGALGVSAKEIISGVHNASVNDLWLYCLALAGFVNTGIIAAFYVERFIRAAENAHEANVAWWYKKYSDELAPGSTVDSIKMTLDSNNPPLCGGGPSPITSFRGGLQPSDIVAKLMRQSRYPLVFVLAWLGFNYVVLVYLNLAKYKAYPWWAWTLSRVSWWAAVLLPMFLLITWAAIYHVQRKEFNEYLDVNTKTAPVPNPSKPTEPIPNQTIQSPGSSADDHGHLSRRYTYNSENDIENRLDRDEPPPG